MTLTENIRLSPAWGFEFKASPKGEIEGLASPFGGISDSYGDVIAAGAFAKSLQFHAAEGTAPAMLWSHDGSQPVGRWEVLAERPSGLHVKGTFSLNTAAGAQAYEHARAGSATGLSIGGYFKEWRENSEGGRLITQVDLIEVSLVACPAAPRARVQSVKSALTLNTRSEFFELLHATGLSRGAAEKLSRGGWPALGGDTFETIEINELAREIRGVAALFAKKG